MSLRKKFRLQGSHALLEGPETRCLPFCRTSSWSPCGIPSGTSPDSPPARRTWTVCRWRCASPSTAPCSSFSRKWQWPSPSSARCWVWLEKRPWPGSVPSRTIRTNGRRHRRHPRTQPSPSTTKRMRVTACCTCRSPRSCPRQGRSVTADWSLSWSSSLCTAERRLR